MENHRRKRLLGGLLLVTLLLPASFTLYLKYVAKGHEQALTRPPANLAAFLRHEKTPPGYQVQTYFAGTELELKVHFLWGKEGGPILAIFGGIHGDEAAGYLTAERYTNLKIKKAVHEVYQNINKLWDDHKMEKVIGFGLAGAMLITLLFFFGLKNTLKG